MNVKVLVRRSIVVDDSKMWVKWSTFAPECMCGESKFNRWFKDVDVSKLLKKDSDELDNRKLKKFLFDWMENNDN